MLNFVIETFDKRNSELKNKMEEILLTLNDSNIEKLIDLSDESMPDGMCKYKQTSIFKNIDAGVFANNILHLSNKSLYPLCMFISQHYEFCSNIYNTHYNYNDDLITLQQVNDIIETVLMSILYGAEMKTMMPKLKSTSHIGMELIRPMYLIKEEDIIAWSKYNGLTFINCACNFSEKITDDEDKSKRLEMKKLINKI